MANIVNNKLTVYGDLKEFLDLLGEIKIEAKASGGYHDRECLLFAIRDLKGLGEKIEFETYWHPPTVFLRELTRKYQKLVFCLSFLSEDYEFGRLVYAVVGCVNREESIGLNTQGQRRLTKLYEAHHVVERCGVRVKRELF